VERKSDGEFWMSYKDFCKHFSEVTICTVGPDFDGDGVADNVGKLVLIQIGPKKQMLQLATKNKCIEKLTGCLVSTEIDNLVIELMLFKADQNGSKITKVCM
jgi:hypothetical protein